MTESMESKVVYIIEAWDDNDYWPYKGWTDRVIEFECEPEAEARVERLFKYDTSILGAKILRVEKEVVKKILNPKHITTSPD